MTKNIRRIQHAGRPSCYCDGDINFVDYGDCGSYACYGGTDMCGGKKGKEKDFEGLPCNTPRYESARYLGLLLYAVDAGEQRVGSWELSTALPVVFWLPPDLACEGKSVMHANARPKALVEHLTFRAPSPGVGPITFRALIKQGATEGGAFYWPVAPAQGALTMHTVPTAGTGAASGDLTLTESTGTTPMQVRENAIVRLCLLLPVLMNSLYSLSLSLPPFSLSPLLSHTPEVVQGHSRWGELRRRLHGKQHGLRWLIAIDAATSLAVVATVVPLGLCIAMLLQRHQRLAAAASDVVVV